MNDNINYTSISDIQEYWKNNIAPSYFDFVNDNLYRSGTFGYISEVMSNVTENTYNAIVNARREFYTLTAKFKKTLYKKAAMYNIDLPMTTPSTCKSFMIIPQKEIIEKSTFINGIYTCVLDNTMKIMVNDKPFMLDYPIIILTKKVGDNYTHTTHYDTHITNSLSNISNKYLMNLIINSNGVNYLSINTLLRQVELNTMSAIITKDTNIDIVTMDFMFDGNLANFEVYYTENNTSSKVYVPKLLENALPIDSVFVYYTLINDNCIRLTFPKSIYFTPKLNANIDVEIYTSLGNSGNFKSYDGDLVVSLSSEKYPYNNNMTITGKINGSAIGGRDKITDEEFKEIILNKEITNNTITSANDMQIYFDSIGEASKNKLLFRKKRDDALFRIYSTYLLLKDDNNNVVPTNTLNLNSFITDYIVDPNDSNRVYLNPGTLFEYMPNIEEINYNIEKIDDITITDNLDIYDDNSRFVFTTPFLTSINLNPNIVTHFLNSVNETIAVEYAYINDNAFVQFISNKLSINRNAIIGENYYKISVSLMPTSDIDMSLVATKNDPTLEDNIKRAPKDGKLISCVFDTNKVIATVLYTDETQESFDVSNYVTVDDDVFTYNTGYNLNISVGDTFVTGDILATKKDTDLGKIRILGDIENVLTNNLLYLPFILEDINIDSKICTFSAYLSTSDKITNSFNVPIYGVYSSNGMLYEDSQCPINNLVFNISTFYKNTDINYSHIYSDYNFYKNYTMTNTYSITDPISIITQIDYIRSDITYIEGSEAVVAEYATETLTIDGVVIDGETISIGDDTYELAADTALTVAEGNISVNINAYTVKATNTLKVDTNPTVGDSMTISGKTYNFVTDGTASIDGDIDVETLLVDTQLNIVNAILGNDSINTPNAYVTCDTFTADILTITSLIGGTAGNSIGTTSLFNSPTNLFSSETLLTGDDCSASNAVTALISEINLSDTQGVGASIGDGTTVVLTADTAGVAGNLITIEETLTNGSFTNDATNLSGGSDEIPEGPYGINIKEFPMVKANWCKNYDNITYLINTIKENYNNLISLYYSLENNFGIDLKFINTYGKSKFFKVGIRDDIYKLDNINCSFKFGANISSLSSTELFIEKFKSYVKEYIESFNTLNTDGQSIYIMNLVSSLKNDFPEINYLEYYGMNNYGYEVQKIEAISTNELSDIEKQTFIPEFINIYTLVENGVDTPQIIVEILN